MHAVGTYEVRFTEGMNSAGRVNPNRKRCTPGCSTPSAGAHTVALAEYSCHAKNDTCISNDQSMTTADVGWGV